MNGRQRVLKTIAHQQPDRVPVGEFGIDHDHVSAILGRHTYWRNRKDTTLALWQGRRDEVVESMKQDYAQLVETLDYDLVPVELVPPKGPAPQDPPRQIEDGMWEGANGEIYKYAAANDSIMCVTPPAAREELSDECLQAAREKLLNIDDSQYELIDFIADQFAETRALVFRGVDTYDTLMSPFGGDQAHQLMLTVTAPDEIAKMHDAAAQRNRTLLEHCAARGVLVAMQHKDWGTTTGLMISPQSIRDLFMPVSRRLASDARELGMSPFFHCCGQIWDILDDFTEAGFEGYQSVQASAGMDWAGVKARYGDKLTIWAGVQCETLIEGTLQDVENEVTEAMQSLMPGGGFIFGSTNSVQYGAKTENYLKAIQIVREKGRYD